LVELAPDGIIIATTGGHVISINAAYSRLTGYSKEEVIGKHFTKLPLLQVSLRDFPKYLKFFGLVALGKDQPPMEFLYTHKDGSKRWGEAHFKLIQLGRTKREVIGILRDITNRKHDEERIDNLLEELKRSVHELEYSNRELDDYTYAVSHDLKSPLRTIESFSDFIIEDYSDSLDDTGKEYLLRIKSATNRMQGLIDDLLLISRVGRKHLEIEMIDINQTIEVIKDDFDEQIKQTNGEIISTKMPKIKTQRTWIRQIFANLISNGLKFNKSTPPKVWLDCEDLEEYYKFSVKDNGIGIDKKYHDKIFKIFQRLHTDEEYPGTGAGLTICKKIVDSWGGEIWLESALGKGTTFFFTIPKRIDKDKISTQTDDVVLQQTEEMQESQLIR
jgi:PAS domain S-box-containing protein